MLYLEKSDVRYLLVLRNYNDLPAYNKLLHIDFGKITTDIINQMPDFDLTPQKLLNNAYIDAAKYVMAKEKTPKLANNAHKSFGKYRKALKNYYKNYRYKGQIFETSDEFYKELKNDCYTVENLMINRLTLYDINHIQADQIKKIDIYGELIFMRDILNQNIDINQITVAEFVRLQSITQNRIKQQQKQNRKLKKRK